MKVVFIDYSGTLVRLAGPLYDQFAKRIIAHSDIKSSKELWQIVFALIKGFEAIGVGEDFMTREEMVYACLESLREDYHLEDDFHELVLAVKHLWAQSDIFPDAREFMEKCPYPVYVVSNIGAPYVAKCLERAGVTAMGIITGELVHAYKPNPRLMQMALALTDTEPGDVIHIGDEYNADVLIPTKYGIRSYLIDREGTVDAPEECKVKDMRELLKLI